jgi:hypothetical protein
VLEERLECGGERRLTLHALHTLMIGRRR